MTATTRSGVALHYTGPLEHAAHAYHEAHRLGLHAVRPRSDQGVGTFTAVVTRTCRWDHLVALVEQLAAPAQAAVAPRERS